jgi:predicted PurR-regulated permease PerM
MKVALYTLFVILAAILFNYAVARFDVVLAAVSAFLSKAVRIISPFIYGFFIAYLLNPAVRALEGLLLAKTSFFAAHKERVRIGALIISFTVILGLTAIIISYIIPEIIESTAALINGIKKSPIYNTNSDFYTKTLPQISETFGITYTPKDVFEKVINPVMQALSNFPTIFSTVLTQARTVLSVFFNIVMGVVIAFYMLMEKEQLGERTRKIVMIVFKPATAEKILTIARNSTKMFEKFFIGKIIDSVIIGILFFITCIFIKPPFVLLLSLIIGLTNIIPYFGPFIGAVPVVFITALDNPTKGLWIAIDILVIQQFDGNILGPKILGDSTGVKPLDIIFAIVIGGALFGPLGMFFGVPVYAVAKTAVATALDRRYEKKYLSGASAPQISKGD